MSREPEKGSIEFAVNQLHPTAEPETTPEEVTEPVESIVEPEAEEQETVLEEVEAEEEESPEETEESEVETDVEEEVEEEVKELEDYYAVKIDGDEYQVTLDELQSGYQRQKDYTKKTQSVAEQRKVNETKTAELETLYQDFLTQSQQATELLNRDLKKFEMVDWEKLKNEDPMAYVQKQIEVQEARQAKADIVTQAQVVYEHSQQTRAVERQQQIEHQRKEALRLFPAWTSEDKATANQLKIIEYAKSVDYTDQDLASIVNAKELLVLDKARKYDLLQKTKQGITKKKRPAIRKMVKSKGIAPKGHAKKKTLESMKGSLHKSGSIQDAARLLYERQQQTG